MSGRRRCHRCGLHDIGYWERFCWFCRNGYDPRGPFAGTKQDAST